MKKLVLSVAVATTMIFAACSSDDDGGKSCEQRVNDIVDAAQAFSNDANEATCQAYVTALQAYINQGCPGSDTYQGTLDDLDCTGIGEE